MKRTLFTLFKLYFSVLLIHSEVLADSFIDPIKFGLSTTASQVAVNEDFEMKITATYLNIPSGAAYVFEGSNSFKLKLITPEGFIQTGGDFQNFAGTELSNSKRSVTYTVRGKFTSVSQVAIFQLLRSHKNSDNQSTFIEVGRLSCKMVEEAKMEPNAEARVMITESPSHIPYMTITELIAGSVDATAQVVFITDENKAGLFRLNELSTAPGDGVLTIITSDNKKYERVYDQYVNPRWWGILGDGATNETALWQAMINNTKVRDIYVPKGVYRFNAISLVSDKHLTFEKGTIIEGVGNLETYQYLINVKEVNNVTFVGNGLVIKNNRSSYEEDQNRGAIKIMSSKNVSLSGISVKDSPGDAFYIGTSIYGITNENIHLQDIQADNIVRQGLSIINGRNILVENALFSNINGTGGSFPKAGIDCEPNTSAEFLDNIRLINIKTKNCDGPGILITLDKLTNSDKVVDIVIENHTDDGSMWGHQMGPVAGIVNGKITIKNPLYQNTRKNGFLALNYSSQAPAVHVLNPTVLNATSELGYGRTAYMVYRHSGQSGSDTLGNIHFFNAMAKDTRVPALTSRGFEVKDIQNTAFFDKVTIENPTFEGIINPIFIRNASVDLVDRRQQLTHNMASNFAPNVNDKIYKYFNNSGASSVRTLSLGAYPAYPGYEFRAELSNNYELRIKPDITSNILPLSLVAGKYISSNVKGSSIVLKKSSATNWVIQSIVGTWNVEP